MGIGNMLKEFIKTLPGMSTVDVKVSITVPSHTNDIEFSAGAIFYIIVLCFIMLLWISGMIVQYTKLLDKQDYNDESVVKLEERKSKLGLFFLSWSPALNAEKLFTVKPSGDQTLNSLNGVRVLSICWVIVGHGFGFVFLSPVTNGTTSMDIVKEPLFGIIPGGVFAVDSFFFLSGLLSFYLLAIKMYPRQGKTNFFMIYFHRYYRLIFPVLFVEGFAIYLFKHLGDGPYYPQVAGGLADICDKYWWSNFLFINNLVPWVMNDECISWVWYLANDWQFFLMTPPIVYLYCKKRHFGFITCALLIIICMLINGIYTAMYDFSISIMGVFKENPMDLLYSKPYARMGAYFVGGIVGLSYFEYSTKEKYREFENTLSTGIFLKLKNSRLLSLFSLLFGFGLTSLFVFPQGQYLKDCGLVSPNCWSKFPAVIYNATSRPMFVTGIALAIMPTLVGRLRAVNGFLSNEIFSVLARLNYMVYLIHCLVMFWILADLRQGNYVNFVNQWYFSIGIMIFSFLFSIPTTMMFEVPFMNIEKYILFPAPQKKGAVKESKPKNGAHYEPLVEENETFDTIKKQKEI